MNLSCPFCRQEVPLAQIFDARKLATCLDCRRVFEIVQINTPSSDVPIPADMQLDRNGKQLVLSWRWFNFTHVFMLFFCIVWDSFLFFWYSQALSTNFNGGFNLIMVIFPLGHVAAGVAITWSTLAGFLNSTYLSASPEQLQVRHSPIWMPGQQSLSSKQISQLFCRERESRTRNGVSVSYEVYALLKNNQEVKLVSMSKPEQAAFIEQAIEKHLGIVNRVVPNEIG